MKRLNKHILDDISKKLSDRENNWERQMKIIEPLSEEEISCLAEIVEIIEAAEDENNLTENELREIEKLADEFEEIQKN